MEHTLALIGRAHQGDKEARDTLFEENTGLICGQKISGKRSGYGRSVSDREYRTFESGGQV